MITRLLMHFLDVLFLGGVVGSMIVVTLNLIEDAQDLFE
jgi:hypothetical protein